MLYTGDYSMEEDRHLMGAEVPAISPDLLIVESTFGVAEHGRREVGGAERSWWWGVGRG